MCKNAGFTLIEVLVVVLIIGILAAIAVPQYRKAVVKAQVAKVLPLLKSIQEAQERFYMANGYYTTDKEDLDIDFEIGNKNKINLTANSAYFYGAPWISRCYSHATEGNCGRLPGKFTCNGSGSAIATEVCKTYGKPVYSWTPHFTCW